MVLKGFEEDGSVVGGVVVGVDDDEKVSWDLMGPLKLLLKWQPPS